MTNNFKILAKALEGRLIKFFLQGQNYDDKDSKVIKGALCHAADLFQCNYAWIKGISKFTTFPEITYLGAEYWVLVIYVNQKGKYWHPSKD